ncbi:MAG TPA: rhomboid family intramembrane serine protease [Candidatus Limnocylindrales bacterium]|nr:rhomboid family intramembrane serine protease [Candidatus Limnocylindrales bacterium]
MQHEAAQRGDADDNVRQRVMPTPWVRRESSISLTKLVFGANVAVFIAMVFASGSIEGFPGEILGHFGANWGPYTLAGDWWRLVTYMFLHGGVMHIAFNMWCLWDLGALCESLYGTWTFGVVYLMTGVAGGLASVAWHPAIPSVGASGAIFGLAGALIASLYLGEFSLPSYAIQANMKSLLFFVGFNILFGVSALGDLFGIHVDNACHIGGLLSGLMLGALIARVAPDHDNVARRAGVLALVAMVVAGAGLAVRQWRSAPFRMGRALEAITPNTPDRVVAQLKEIVRQQPNSVQAHFALAQTYFGEEKFSEAEAEFKRVLQLQPQHAAARFELGMVFVSERRLDDANSAFAQLVAQDANDPNGHLGMGLVLAAEGNQQEAIGEYKNAIRLNPQISGAQYELGRSYTKLKMYDEAIAAYLKERENMGDDPDIETALADAYQAKGMTQQAREASDKAAELKRQR